MKRKNYSLLIRNVAYCLLFALLGLLSDSAFSQGAAVNTSGASADPSAMLDVSSNNSGILIPRMTEAQKNAINTPATGLMIYQTDGVTGFWYSDGTSWVQSIGAVGATGAAGATGVTGPIGLLPSGTSAGNTPYWDGTQWVVSSSNIFNNGGSVGIGTSNPDASALIDMSSNTKGTLITRMTTAQRDLIVSPAQGLQIFNTTTNCVEFFVGGLWQQMHCGCSNIPVVPLGGNSIASSDYIMWFWNSSPDALGYKYNTVNNYNSAVDIGNSNYFIQAGLNPASSYNIYIWAYNSCGVSISYMNITQITSPWNCGKILKVTHTAGAVAPVTKTINYGTMVSALSGTSKCWITQNLGADHQGSAFGDASETSAGWYWQFNKKQGYKHDGTIVTPAWTIISISENYNWLQTEDPCYLLLGSGWRLPTDSEWVNADIGWSNSIDTYASEFKLHAAGTIYGTGGPLASRGSAGWYWSSTQISSVAAYSLAMGSFYSNHSNDPKSAGSSVRCLRD